MTKEERAVKWLEKVPGADELSMEERMAICDFVAKRTAIIFIAVLVGEFAILYLVSGGAVFEWMADQINHFAEDGDGTRKNKSLAWFGVILYLPFFVIPFAVALIYRGEAAQVSCQTGTLP